MPDSAVTTQLCIVDDDDAVIDSMRVLLKSHGLDTRAFSSAEAILKALDNGLVPSCIVSDVRMGGMSGLDLQQELRRRGSTAPLILVTGHADVSMAVSALKAGAADFIEKPYDETVLVDAIRRTLAQATLHEETRRTKAVVQQRLSELSARQRQVMALVVQGLSSKEVAIELGISPRTVETYRLWIMEKMEARNLADLVRMALLADSPGDSAALPTSTARS